MAHFAGARPKYRVIVETIKDEIADGHLKPGDKLQSTVELCEEFSCSATVVNQAVLVLTGAGIIEGVPGVGRFVAQTRG